MRTILVRSGRVLHIAFTIARYQKFLTSLRCNALPFWLWDILFIRQNMYFANISAKIYNYWAGLFTWWYGMEGEVFLIFWSVIIFAVCFGHGVHYRK